MATGALGLTTTGALDLTTGALGLDTGALGLTTGALDLTTGALGLTTGAVGLTTTGALGWLATEVDLAIAGCAGAKGLFGRTGLVEAIGLVATGAPGRAGMGLAGAEGLAMTATAGLAGRSGAAAAAFWTARIALAGPLPWALAGVVGLLATALEPLPTCNKPRMRAASSSLIELLWLFAAIDSFSAASSTSLLSRPRSRDSS